MTTANQTLGALVTANPAAAKVFHRHHLDFCCGGHESLARACAASGLSPEMVLQEIDAATDVERDLVRWDRRAVEDPVLHILDRYHAPLRLEIPRLVALARKVERVHGDKADCPVGLADLLAEVWEGVDSHLAKEEGILFPLILMFCLRGLHPQQQPHRSLDHGCSASSGL